jgi:3-oxo-5-alpha-steroid 4-dehydrogenase 3
VGKVDEYVIPHGDWFEIVSTPHYLAEIVRSLSLSLIHDLHTVIEWNWGAEGSHFMFMLMIQVIYAGVVFGSGGADLTIWLLFGFVVSSSLHSRDVSLFSLIVAFLMFYESWKFVWCVGCRCQIWYLQLQKHIGGIFRNLTIIIATVLQLFHLYVEISKNTFPIVACSCHHGYHKFLTCDEKFFLENQISLIDESCITWKTGFWWVFMGCLDILTEAIEFYLIVFFL